MSCRESPAWEEWVRNNIRAEGIDVKVYVIGEEHPYCPMGFDVEYKDGTLYIYFYENFEGYNNMMHITTLLEEIEAELQRHGIPYISVY